MEELRKGQVVTKVSAIHPLETMNICTKYHLNPSGIDQTISLWTKMVDRPTNCHPLDCPASMAILKLHISSSEMWCITSAK